MAAHHIELRISLPPDLTDMRVVMGKLHEGKCVDLLLGGMGRLASGERGVLTVQSIQAGDSFEASKKALIERLQAALPGMEVLP